MDCRQEERHKLKPDSSRIPYILLTPKSMIPSKLVLPPPPPPPTPPPTITTTTPAAPLGRGHRVKKPNARLYAALLEADADPSSPSSPSSSSSSSRPMLKPPRAPPAKKPRRSKSTTTTEDGDGAERERGERARIWCHQCHQDRSSDVTQRCKACGKSYCAGCLARR